MALDYTQGNKLILRSLCIIDTPGNDVEQLLPRSVAYYGGFTRKFGVEAKLWKFERARSLIILLVHPVDKVV